MEADEILKLLDHAKAELGDAAGLQEIEEIRIKYLGSKGKLKDIMRSVKDAPPEERPAFGRNANRFKQELTDAVERKTDIH